MNAVLRTTLALLTLLLLTSLARAAGPEPAHIPADAKAYLHLDTSLLRASTLLEQFRKDAGPSNPLDQTLGMLSTFLGFNPLEDLDGITFYSPTLVKDEGVLLMYGKVDEDAILKRLETFPEHIAQDYGDHKLHTWRDNDRHATVAGAIIPDKLMLWADNLDRLKAALDVIDGKTKGNYAPSKDFPKGALFAAGLSDVPTLFDKPDQWVIRLAHSFELALSENHGTLTARITALMTDAEQAAQVKKVAEGLQAFAALNQDKIPALAPLIAQIKITTETTHTTLTLDRPAETAFADIKNIQKAMQANKPATPKTDAGQP